MPKPDYYLGVGSGGHGWQTGKMLMKIENVLLKEKPDLALVFGDTNTTLAGALAAAKLHIPLAHVEAGLRSYNRTMPEEINRVLTDHCSDILFCPTETAVRTLQKEGFTNIVENGKLVNEKSLLRRKRPSSAVSDSLSAVRGQPLVINVGDVMLDIAMEVKKLIQGKTTIQEKILARYFLRPKNYVLVTIHRAVNTDKKENLQNIMEALKQLARRGIRIFFPAHPRTERALQKFNLMTNISENLIITKPVSYMEMVALESNAKLVVTDSGGVQKEAYFFKNPCIIPRDETEWTELVEIGWNKVVGTKKADIVNAVLACLSENFANKPFVDFYGDGRAHNRIAAVLKNYRA